MKRVLRTIALLMVMCMLITACGQKTPETQTEPTTTETAPNSSSEAATEESAWPEYLNMEASYPIIKEGYEDTIKLTAAIGVSADAGEWEDLWVTKYLKDKYNIEIEVEYILDSALSERKNLMMNSGELPDLMLNMAFTPQELTRYGAQEGLLLAFDEYISEELTPHMYPQMTDDVVGALTAGDGHMYTLPGFNDPEEIHEVTAQHWINVEYLKEAGIAEVPKTLDDFVAAMYALKEADVTGVGSDNFYPVGGGMEVESLTPFLLNAFGYNVANDNYYGLLPAVKDGDAVIPVYDMEVYKEFLTLMNQFYQDGIINSNYFTIEATESSAQLVERQTASLGANGALGTLETFKEWSSITPLTSEWQTEPEQYDYVPLLVGGFVVSADTEYPELCLRFADIFYDLQESRMFWSATPANTEYNYEGYIYQTWDAEKKALQNVEPLPEGVSQWVYMLGNMHGFFPEFGSLRLRSVMNTYNVLAGGENVANNRDNYDPDTIPSHHYRLSMFSNNIDYVTYGYPTIIFFDEETSQKISDIKTVLEPYVKEQVALFITGGRDLSEVDDFVAEMESMGMAELSQIYVDYYNSTK